ncbi:MAG: HAMP domain-containing sensor histidine kinase [Gaiellales bacterium]
MRAIWPPRSLSVKLGLVLFLIVAAALAIVYLAVVPRLESRLVDERYRELQRAAIAEPGSSALSLVAAIRQASKENPAAIQTLVEFAATQQNARIVVFQELDGNELLTVADSAPVAAADVIQDDPLALRTASSGERSRGRVTRNGVEYAQVAVPVGDTGFVLLLSEPLTDLKSAVSVVRRDFILYGGVALAASWLLGALLALRLTGRIRRLETAAERLADGDFTAQIVDTGQDELTDLAEAFDRMRVRLAQLDRARREFIANASHELRTPLFALGGFLELLDDEEMDESTRRDFLETARSQVERLTRLATDLLDLSRLDADQVAVSSEPIDLSALARELVEEFAALAEGSGHVLRAAGSGDVVALGDEDRIVQIGRSFVENALRHTPPGTEIEVEAAVFVGRAQLAVRDDGPGIPLDEQQHVFDRFYRGAGGAAFGSGIGLAIARELAQLMGGAIELRSEPGSTSFTLVLSRAQSEAFSRENALAPS